MFTKIQASRLKPKLDFYQSRFRASNGTNDYLLNIKLLIEKSTEYNPKKHLIL